MLNSKRIFQLFLVGFAVFSLLVGSDVIHGGVTASVIRPLDVAPTGGGGGGGGGCNPNNYVLYGTRYTVKILDAETDRGEYAHGDTVTFTGTVQLAAEPVYINDCYQYLVGDAYNADPSVVSVALSGPFGDLPAENSGQYFKAEVTVPLKADAGTVSYHVTATYGSSSDATDVSFKVAEYVPVLNVKMSHGEFVYPGESFTVSGSQWKPDGDVELDYGGAGSGPNTTPVISTGTFPEVKATVPEDAREGTYTITGTEEGLPEAHSDVVVKWRQLTVQATLQPGQSVQQDTTVTLVGKVVDQDGKPVQAAISVTTDGPGYVHFQGDGTTDPSGAFTYTARIYPEQLPGTILINVKANKPGGYKDGSADTSLTVTCKPYGLDAGCPSNLASPVSTGVAVVAAATGATTAVAASGSEDTSDGEEGTDKQPPIDPDDPCADKENAYRKAFENVNDIKSELAPLTDKLKTLEATWNSTYLWATSGVKKTYDGGKLVVKGTASAVGGGISHVAHVAHGVEVGYELGWGEGLWGLVPDVMKEPEDMKKVRDRINEVNGRIREVRRRLQDASDQLNTAQGDLDLCHVSSHYRNWYKATYNRDAPKVARFEPKPTPTPQQTGETIENPPQEGLREATQDE